MTAIAGDTPSLKAQLRREFRRRRAAHSRAERRRAAERAATRLARCRWFRQARHVALYLPYGSELDTAPLRALCEHQGQRLYVPVIRDGGQLRFARLAPGTRLRGNRYGIAEPSARRLRRPGSLDVVIVPLTAFDRHGYRLGTGGGYYDRSFAQRRGRRPKLVGYAFATQQAEALPHETWDVRLDAVVTERAIHYFQGAVAAWPTG